MVIQRWQTVFLFVSLVLLAIFSVSEYGVFHLADGAELPIQASENIGYWIYNIVIVLLLLIAIFLFKNPGLQKTLIIVGILMMGGSAIWGYNYLHSIVIDGASLSLTYSWILLIVAFGLSIFSIVLISSDQSRLRAADRLR